MTTNAMVEEFVPVRSRRGPQIPLGAVRVSKSGSDLLIPFDIISKALGRNYNFHTDPRLMFQALVSEKARQLRLVVSKNGDVRPYVTSGEARSVLITCRTLLTRMGNVLPRRDYPVDIAPGELTISFATPIKSATK